MLIQKALWIIYNKKINRAMGDFDYNQYIRKEHFQNTSVWVKEIWVVDDDQIYKTISKR
jgi:hypothetical protein